MHPLRRSWRLFIGILKPQVNYSKVFQIHFFCLVTWWYPIFSKCFGFTAILPSFNWRHLKHDLLCLIHTWRVQSALKQISSTSFETYREKKKWHWVFCSKVNRRSNLLCSICCQPRTKCLIISLAKETEQKQVGSHTMKIISYTVCEVWFE